MVSRAHRTNLELSQSILPEVEVGSRIILRAKVTCSAGCDLRGHFVEVRAPVGLVATGTLDTCTANVSETDEIVFVAPDGVGDHVWSVVFPRHEAGSAAHEASRERVAFRTKPHTASVAVWDVPSPVPINRPFSVKVGVKCSAACEPQGRVVEVRDDAGAKMGGARLGGGVWPGTRALYWTEVGLTAPAVSGLVFWVAAFTGVGMTLAHKEASARFSFMADRPPEHLVTIKVFGGDTCAPVGGAEVRLGIYRAVTDVGGLARLEMPEGTYDLKVWSDGFEGPPMSVEVAGDVAINVEAVKTLTAAEREELQERYEASQWG